MADDKPMVAEPVETCEYDCDLIFTPIVLKVKGQPRDFRLYELSGEARDEYLTAMSTKQKVDSSGKVIGLNDFRGLRQVILSNSLFDVSTGSYISVDELKKLRLPNRVMDALTNKILEMSGLSEKKGS